jgi:probable rRNA maturation factor
VGEVVILLTGDAAVRALNARFLGKDRPTNVLAFPDAGAGRLGDIALAHGVCAREAAEQAKPLADHLRHLVVHGVLHLIGYDHTDDDDAARMEALERQLLAGMNIPDPYAETVGARGE